MAKKDKFEYSTNYLANIHAPVAIVEEVEQAKEEPTKEETTEALDEKEVSAPKAKSKRKPKA